MDEHDIENVRKRNVLWCEVEDRLSARARGFRDVTDLMRAINHITADVAELGCLYSKEDLTLTGATPEEVKHCVYLIENSIDAMIALKEVLTRGRR